MNVNEALKELRRIKDVAMATVDNYGNPQVRIIDVMAVEDNCLYFLTARGKHFYQELVSNNKVAITAVNEDYLAIRLNGVVEKVIDQEFWLTKIFNDNRSMSDVYPGNSRNILEVFCIHQGELEVFDLSKIPIERYSYNLQGEEIFNHGYQIDETCICCNRCKQGCPQQCIKNGKIYMIEQSHCLHCGLCYEKCPVGAIKKVG
ncbi:pyridoxamine 5'-phosphate oxidase family protein [Thomasclavelia sp.]